MHVDDGKLRLSATDLANHLNCPHLTQRNRDAARGAIRKPHWRDPIALILRERGMAHEAKYLSHLRATEDIVAATVGEGAGSEQTLAAMRDGAPLIYQAPLGNDRWHGRADFLRRIEAPSRLGAWSYEVIDAKLATRTKAGTVLQLCVYSELVAELQGQWPQRAYVVTPHHNFELEPYRLPEFAAYYRLVKRRLAATLASPGITTYPEPVNHCEVCDWWLECDRRRRGDDHLSFVADISRLQIHELRRQGINTLEALGELQDVSKPARGSTVALTRSRDQAAIQLAARRSDAEMIEILRPLNEGHGLARLPASSAGDLYLDLEGDRLAAGGGRDYLFGYTDPGGDYVPVWAINAEEERAAFERLVDHILAVFRKDPAMHVYHFGAYEPNAFKRLSGRYATRGPELDILLRAELFVDLHTVVKHALMASVESYSIKELEKFYGYRRAQDMREATASRRAVEWAIEFGEPVREPDFAAHLRAVERYNREDCVSAEKLKAWLERLRDEAARDGHPLPRPLLETGEASETIAETETETREVMSALLEGVPLDEAQRSPEERGQWLLAHLLEWHRREDKAAWWEYFRLCDLPLEDYGDERAALSGLAHERTVGGTATRPIHRYCFHPQDSDVRRRDDVCLPDGERLGVVQAFNLAERTVDIQHDGRQSAQRPTHVFLRRIVRTGKQPESLLELGRWVCQNGIDAPGEHRAARDLILRRPPRLGPTDAAFDIKGFEGLDHACQLGRKLARGVLPVQGPPGTGKTYTGSHMIVDLLRAGKKVGVTAVSHEVIRNLLLQCIEVAQAAGDVDFRCLHKGRSKEGAPDGLLAIDDYSRIHRRFRTEDIPLLGGTSWLWSREDFAGSADVLFVDEAGQMSLADVLAVARGAKNLVLLGDPQQLEQPQQASHPPGAEASALQHVLGAHETMPDVAGLFLPKTWRLHPSICAFTAEAFYEDRLSPVPTLERQAIVGARDLPENGLCFVPVEHEARRSRADEEVVVVQRIVEQLYGMAAAWQNSRGEVRALTWDDVLVVAPYNAQVNALAAALPGYRVGTVDKFQGQQAPVVIVSLTASSYEDAPRGMSFQYSANRFNVATSRAKALCILVGNPKLFEPDCATPEQMRLANAFCRYLELAQTIEAFSS